MVVEIKEFSSHEELKKALEKEISQMKSSLGEYLRRLDEIRSTAEKSKKIREVVLKLSGKKRNKESLGVLSISGFNVILDATPLDELNAIEAVVRSYQKRLTTLQKARKSLKPLDELGDSDGLRLLVVETDGVPERILLKVS